MQSVNTNSDTKCEKGTAIQTKAIQSEVKLKSIKWSFEANVPRIDSLTVLITTLVDAVMAFKTVETE